MAPLIEYLVRSVKYVRGETEAIIFPQYGMFSMGMNMPLRNTSGKRTKDEIIMTLEGAFDGGEDSIKPNDEKHAAARTIPNMKMIGWIILIPMAKPITIGNMGITIPNKKDAIISPKRRVVMEIGADINLSRVCT